MNNLLDYASVNPPAIEIIDRLINEAHKLRASDIHLEPSRLALNIRLRIDGILNKHDVISKDFMFLVISRLKVLSEMNLSEKRIPQDGKISYALLNGEVLDLRLATFPGIYGEKIVIRILYKNNENFTLSDLGFNHNIINKLITAINKLNGFILISGPTGSGKTTTLYTLLSLIKSKNKNIITLEDPIEYTIDSITQGQIYPEIGFTFSQGIRSILRLDPDVIMVGEVRDKETANTALRASLTGHLVFSTVHTNTASGALMRLLDMGLEPYILNSSLTGILAQRLVPLLCQYCFNKVPITSYEKYLIKKYNINVKCHYKNVSVGCKSCNFLGYKGRTVVAEFLVITDELRLLLTKNPILSDIKNQAYNDGMVSIVDDALIKVNENIISLEDLFLII